ncbi:MAG: hypothetical protein HY293_07045, partial [Planctomycetes bacterium]|nr:hypothetical protein [Planctomycetota bacterium]
MAAWVLLAAAFLLQDASPGDRLKREGWKAVEELGAQAALKPELEKLAAGDDAELRWWAGAALAEIEARAKGAAAYIDVRRVTLEAKEKKASEILADLLAVENLRLTGDLTPAEKAVSVAFKGTPFFEAVDGVCREAGCVLRRRTDGDFEVKIDDGRTIRPNTYAGPTSVAVRSLTFRSQADFRGDPAHRLDLGLSFRMDPR